jgi:putative signal transducing protein
VHELVRTNNAVVISAIEALLGEAGIPCLVLDQNMSVLEGSIGILARRVMVPDAHAPAARALLENAGFGPELRPDGAGT